jgi:hypothetical protein
MGREEKSGGESVLEGKCSSAFSWQFHGGESLRTPRGFRRFDGHGPDRNAVTAMLISSIPFHFCSYLPKITNLIIIIIL